MRWIPFTRDPFDPEFELHSKISTSRWGTPSEEKLLKFFRKHYGPLIGEKMCDKFRSQKIVAFTSEPHQRKVLRGLEKMFDTFKVHFTSNDSLLLINGNFVESDYVDVCTNPKCLNIGGRFRWVYDKKSEEEVYTCDKCQEIGTHSRYNELSPKLKRKLNATIQRTLKEQEGRQVESETFATYQLSDEF